MNLIYEANFNPNFQMVPVRFPLRALLAILLLALVSPLAVAPAAEGVSPLVLVASGDKKILYVAEAGARQIAMFDVVAGKTNGVISLPLPPTGLALAADGGMLYVTLDSPAGEILAFHPATGKASASIFAGHTPMAPVLSPDGKTLYVCNEFNDDVSVIATASGKEIARVPVLREPVAAALTPDGHWLFVANLLPTGPANGDYIGAAVSVIDTVSKQTSTISLPNGSSGVHGICVSPDGRFVYVAHTLGHYQLPTTQLEHGWMNISVLSVIEVATRQLVAAVELDDTDLGAANPWSVDCTADGRFLCVTHAGTHEISVIDRPALQEKIKKISKTKAPYESLSTNGVTTDFTFLLDLRRRLKLTGNGPRGLAVIGDQAYAAEYFSDSLGVVNLLPDRNPEAHSIALGPKAAMSQARRGEMYFNDADLCFQKWQSCASCHPNNARVDGLNWDLLNDGIGNPKNVKSLLFATETAPSMWLGERKDAQVSVRAGFQHIEFNSAPESVATAVDAYLKSLKPVQSPHLVDGKLSESAKRGMKIFNQAGCADCHQPPLFFSRELHDIGTGTGIDANKSFTVPTLNEVWRTAPYLHDGRASTIMEVITKFNPDDLHDETSALSEQERKDLVEYVLSL